MSTTNTLTAAERESLERFKDDLKSLVEATDCFPMTRTLDDFRAMVDGCVKRSDENIRPYLTKTSLNHKLYSDFDTLISMLKKNRNPTKPEDRWDYESGLNDLSESGRALVQSIDECQITMARTIRDQQLDRHLSNILDGRLHNSLRVRANEGGIHDRFYPPARQAKAIVKEAVSEAENRIEQRLDSDTMNTKVAEMAEELVRFVAKDKTIKGLSNYADILSAAKFTADEINKHLGKKRQEREPDESTLG